MTTPTATLAQDRFTTYSRARAPERQRGAYGVVMDGDGRVLVVKAGNGRSYLPGGRIERGETPAEALAREIGEECGWSAEVRTRICEDEQPIFGGAVTLSATYWEARLTQPLDVSPEHSFRWIDPAEALRCLHRRSDREALRTAIG